MSESRIKYFSIRIGAFDADSNPVGFPLDMGPLPLTKDIANQSGDTVSSVLEAFSTWFDKGEA